MEELGFFIDKEGKISFFGEWTKYDPNKERSRSQKHSSSFEDDIENTEYFHSLGLAYNKHWGKNKDMWLHRESYNFASQGMIICFNCGAYYPNELIGMFVPKELTDNQRASLTKLYTTLNNFEMTEIRVASSLCEEVYYSINDYFDAFQINRNSILNRK